jgi:Uma2 family endonuclease
LNHHSNQRENNPTDLVYGAVTTGTDWKFLTLKKSLVEDNTTVRLDRDNETQPDAVLLIEESAGGQARLGSDDVEGAPELVAEVAASSASIDLGDKKRAYRRNGVQEYIVWQVFDRKIDWFRLENDDYVSLLTNEQDIIRSEVFPSLWLDPSALLNGDMQEVLAVLQQGIRAEEHQRFVQRLGQRMKDA